MRAPSAVVALLLVLVPVVAALSANPAAGIGTVEITSPTCGDAFRVGTQVEITWTSSGTGGFVKIELYVGWTPALIEANVSDTGTYTWTIPLNQTPADDASIEITSTADEFTYGSSDYFLILAAEDPDAIVVTAPTASSVWEAGQTYDIAWTADLSVGAFVRIEWDYLFWSTPGTVVANTSNDGLYSWTLPNDQPSYSNTFLRVTSLENASLLGQSACFEVTPRVPPGTITVTEPAGGAVLQHRETYAIRWTTAGVAGPFVKIEVDYLFYTGGDTVTLNTTNNGTYWWTVPSSLTPRSDYFVRVIDLNDSGIVGDSAWFTIQAPPPAGTISVTSPSQGDEWAVGSTHTVAWTFTGAVGSTVRIFLDRHTYGYTFTPELIADGAPNSGSYTWTIPSSHARGAQFIRVASVSDPSIEGASADFQLVDPPPPGSIIVTAPAQGAILDPGNEYPITWTTTGDLGSTVRIEVGRPGETPVPLAASAPNSGEYLWTVANTHPAAPDYSIRVTSVLYPAASAASAPFSITSGGGAGSIVVLRPLTNEVLPVGELTQVKWLSQGTVGSRVRVEAQALGSATPVLLSSAARNSGVFDWTPLGELFATGDYIVRVVSVEDPSIRGESFPFHIQNDQVVDTQPPTPVAPSDTSAYVYLPMAALGVGGAGAGLLALAVVRRRRARAAEAAPPDLAASPMAPPFPTGQTGPHDVVVPGPVFAAAVPSFSSQPGATGFSPPPAVRAPPSATAPTSFARPPALPPPQFPPALPWGAGAQASPIPQVPPAPSPPSALPITAPCPRCSQPCAIGQPRCGWCGLDIEWT